tara:strand:+ start:274 stop:429 length:156 start_codon:yes stop_codon:yes gene_type:complete
MNKKEEKIKDEFNNKVAEILIKAQRGDTSAVKKMRKLCKEPKYSVDKKELN